MLTQLGDPSLLTSLLVTSAEPILLDDAGSTPYMRALLRARAAVALPGETAAVRLNRTVLECLLEKALILRPDEAFELRSVLTAQLGEEVNRAVAADAQLRALYRSPGHSLADVLNSLDAMGLAETAFVGRHRDKHAMVSRNGWVRQDTAAGMAAATAGRAAVPLPVAAPVAAVAEAALEQHAQPAVGSSGIELNINCYPLLRCGKANFSRAEIVFRLTAAAKSGFFSGKRVTAMGSIPCLTVSTCVDWWNTATRK